MRLRFPSNPWQLLLISLFGLFVSGVVALAVVVVMLTPKLPSVQSLSEEQLKVPMRVYSADGELLAEFGEEKRILLKAGELPDLLVKAILAAEDDEFYKHYGIDVTGILRAMWVNLRTGTPGQGASTITMQVARNFFLSPEKTYTRKLKEILLAFKIERQLTKDQILELYLNKIFLGHRAYGFGAAAQVYYGKHPDDLTVPEIAMLAGLPKGPSRNNPLSNPERAIERRNYVLQRMQTLGSIDREAFENASAAPLTASKHALRFNVEAPYVAEMVRQYMVDRYQEESYGGGFHVYTTIRKDLQEAANQALRKGLQEYGQRHGYRGRAGRVDLTEAELDQTYLDDVLRHYPVVGDLLPAVVLSLEEQSAQAYTQDGYVVEIPWEGLSWAHRYIDEGARGPAPKKAINVVKPGDVIYLEYVEAEPAQDEKKTAEGEDEETEIAGHWSLSQVPAVDGAIVSIRPNDGAILALSGGFDFYHSKFNRVIQAERQPGSNLKPFIYSAALQKRFTPATPVSGAPIVIDDPEGIEDIWRPENYSKRVFGETPLRKALTLSLNLVSVRLLRAIEPKYGAEYLERFGFEQEKLPHNLSLALGNASATPLQMATAFAVFANGGYRVEPYFIARIEDADHNLIAEAEPLTVCEAKDCPEADNVPALDPVEGEEATNETTPQPTPTLVQTAQANDASVDDSAPAEAPRYAPRVISRENAFIMTSIMKDVIARGTGRRARELGRADLAGKTGTTNEFRDAWFSGFTQDIVTTAWIGFDNPASLGPGEAGARAALPMWIDFMRVALKDVPEKTLPVPQGVVAVSVDRNTGEPIEPDDPRALVEYFIDGTQPEGFMVDEEGMEVAPAPLPVEKEIPKGLF
ncbi:MAG: penicillin-binding protein 1A [Acidiferrobacterales bacterium]